MSGGAGASFCRQAGLGSKASHTPTNTSRKMDFKLLILTARIRRMEQGKFSQACVCPREEVPQSLVPVTFHGGGGVTAVSGPRSFLGVPSQACSYMGSRDYPVRSVMEQGYPPGPDMPRTGYAACGMLFAVRQEDFLVYVVKLLKINIVHC